MSHSNSSSQHILISFSEYERLKNIETEFEKLQKEQHQKLQIPSTYFFTQFPFLLKEYKYNMSFFLFQVRNQSVKDSQTTTKILITIMSMLMWMKV